MRTVDASVATDGVVVFDARAVAITVAGGGGATLVFGLVGALAALSARPAQRLRAA